MAIDRIIEDIRNQAKKMGNLVKIETTRFLLKSLTEGDATYRYLNWLSDVSVKRFITSSRSFTDLAKLSAYIKEKSENEDIFFLGIYEKSSKLHIGNIKYEPINRKHNYAIMGIMIGDENYRGKGVAGEVIKASAKWLRDNYNIKEILLGVDIDNEIAIKAYEKLGFFIVQTPFIGQSDGSLAMALTIDSTY